MLSEADLDSTISSNDNDLTIPCYDLHRADHPSDVKRRVCIYYKNFLETSRHSIPTRVHQLQNENRGKIM